MSRTPAAHWYSDSLANRVPYTDTVHYDPYDTSIGYGHQEITHLLDILSDPMSPKANKIKSLRLLCNIMVGRQDEAIQHKAFNVLKPFLNQPPNSLLLHSLIALTVLCDTKEHSMVLVPEIPRIVEIVHPDVEVPLRLEAAKLLRRMSEFVGPIDQFNEGKIPSALVEATAFKDSSQEFLLEMFYLLSRLTNIQKVRVPIISSQPLLEVIVKSVSNPFLRDAAVLLACNIAMDKSHHGKSALLEVGILDAVSGLLAAKEVAVRMSALSLISLLAVPKDGKELLSTMPDTADLLQKISSSDPDLYCRRAATKCRIFIAEIPFGKVIVGDVVDPSIPVPKQPESSSARSTSSEKSKKSTNQPEQLQSDKKDKVSRTQLRAEAEALLFIAAATYKRLFGSHIEIVHSLHDGIFCIDETGNVIAEDKIKQLEDEIRATIQSPNPIEFLDKNVVELTKYYLNLGLMDKVGVLKTIVNTTIPCMKLGDFIDYILEPIADTIPADKPFELHPYQNGFVLRTPTIGNSTKLIEWRNPDAQHNMFSEYTEWAKVIGVKKIADLNHKIYTRDIEDLKWTCEGLHKKKLAEIARKLVENFPKKRIVTIAGPSSSNKTTFAKLLQINLRVLGYESLVIEMDDYAQNREETPFGEDGLRDYEAITAFNLKVFGERVKKLLNGEEIPRRKFDFKTGFGSDIETERQKLGDKTFAIFEGIHGLNPELLNVIGQDLVTPIYVAPLTPLSIDATHRFPTTDLRLIRRIIRDHKYRGTSARQTIRRWTSVRLGEERNIFPYQANAQMCFNSSLVYELPVLSVHGRALLSEATIPDESEDANDEITKMITKEAKRILTLLNMFYPITSEEVPHISCIREFIGGSDLKY
ncbi:Phosphoribulokinase / Uridine kinase family protein [Trichomonas vaginalis G3]|uniref:Phosphoribulokinase / Uridine kinase family protein n=1 Tax=Trichomonas vaginalis (strain ATCC PRA-98 / G3) TaxID=412133 RepID=A2DFR6_TRIV3|nr:phosphoribulokinase family protein-related protein family [Trichomonas vaginalis G3]EAY20769.1 Phosphoribulokinase / Uridine kinase family protein [Trichomonas vaginalis G3]KAI5529446.1 phosphoribulokinase family protein-related protein family [Trichomonas vaginalis G3]|eukprot:XP_001581755.1 Phosphoribulokinase / Uridine kinase family protein [Trichomonas vaginalis G3]